MNRCRNCGASELQDLGFIGRLAPFFLKRVFGVRLGTARSSHPLKRLIQKAVAVPQTWLNRMQRPSVMIEMQLCQSCSFIQTRLPFEEQAINRLYLDYRSASYQSERIEYEPTYAAIASDVGNASIEIETRVTAATNFIQRNTAAATVATILDYGGADGKFLPRIDAEKFVFEISNTPPVPGVVRLDSDTGTETYSLVQLAHVIEHVVQPLDLVKHVAAKVAPGGFLYLETPQELTDEQRSALQTGSYSGDIAVHEHINSYCIPAVSGLLQSAGMQLVAVEATPVNVGWATAVHIRALGRKQE